MRIVRNRRNKVGLCVAGVAACLALAAVGALMAVTGTALAAKPVSSTFDVTASGVVSFSGTTEGRTGKKDGGNIQLYFRGPDSSAGPMWDLSYFNSACFSESYPDSTVIFQTADGILHVTYWFFAFGTDGMTEISYRLKMSSKDTYPDNWHPTETDDTTIIILTDWVLAAQSKKRKNSSSDACTGEGSFTDPVEVVVERTN